MLQTINMELQKTYNCPQAVTYTPCVDELCAVQFSSDMVRTALVKLFVNVQIDWQFFLSFFFCKHIELVQRPDPGFGRWPEEGQGPLHWLWQRGGCPCRTDQTTGCWNPAILSLCKFKVTHINLVILILVHHSCHFDTLHCFFRRWSAISLVSCHWLALGLLRAVLQSSS